MGEVEELAYKYEQDYGGCSQAVVGAFKKALGEITDDVFKASLRYMDRTGCVPGRWRS